MHTSTSKCTELDAGRVRVQGRDHTGCIVVAIIPATVAQMPVGDFVALRTLLIARGMCVLFPRASLFTLMIRFLGQLGALAAPIKIEQ